MGGTELLECANCGGNIGKLETPRLFDQQVVCVACWAKLSATKAESMVESVRDDLGYESRDDYRPRMASAPRRVMPEPRATSSPILIIGRVIFGALAAVTLVMAIRAKINDDDRDIATSLGVFVPCVVIFLATFVKRAF